MNSSGEALQVILNPASSGGAGGRLRPRLEANLAERGIPFKIHETRAPGHGRELAAAVADGGFGRVLCVGGDGTLHEVANGLLEVSSGRPTLAVVPLGTGNDFFRILGLPRTLEAALGLLEHGEVVPFDVGRARWEGGEAAFVNLMGVGLDVEVLRQREGFRRLSGFPQYLAAVLAALVRFRPVDLRLLADGGVFFQGQGLLAAVTVGATAAGGIRLSPQARPDDGFLDLFVVEPLGPLKVARYLPRVLRGAHGGEPELHQRRIQALRIESPGNRPLHFEMDGELFPDPSPWIEVRVDPGVLPVLCPRRSPAR